MKEQPTWKNTLLARKVGQTMDSLASAARSLGYPYIEWNGRVLSSARDNGMWRVGKSCDHPLCMAADLDSPLGAPRWGNGLAPVLLDAKLMAHDMLPDGTLLGVVSDRIMRATMALVWPDTGDLKSAIESALAALADGSLRGHDTDGSIAVGVAGVRKRMEQARRICETEGGK